MYSSELNNVIRGLFLGYDPRQLGMNYCLQNTSDSTAVTAIGDVSFYCSAPGFQISTKLRVSATPDNEAEFLGYSSCEHLVDKFGD